MKGDNGEVSPPLPIASSSSSPIEATAPLLERQVDALFIGKSLVAGGLAGMVAKTGVAPLDRIKILLQAQNKHYKHLGIKGALVKVVKLEGFFALYRGNGAQMVRIFPYAATQFTSHQVYKRAFPVLFNVSPTVFWVQFISGSCAGLSAVTLTYPLDAIRARLAFQTQDNRRYKGILHTGQSIFKEEGGVKGLYRGIVPTYLGMIPYAGTSFSVFDFLKRTFLSTIPHYAGRDGRGEQLNTGFRLLCGASAGLAAQSLSYPFDVARRRMQLAMMYPETKHLGHGTFDTLKHVYYKDGIVRGLYRGLSINYIRAMPMHALSFTTYEFVCEHLGIPSTLRIPTG